MARLLGRLAGLGCGLVLGACSGFDAVPADRVVELAEPLAPEPDGQDSGEAFVGTIELPGARILERHIAPTPLTPIRGDERGEPVVVEFRSEGLIGASARLGLLPPRGAARQEVAFDMPGQAPDPRSVWLELEIEADAAQRFELPSPGPSWHAPWAVVAIELRQGRTVVPVLSGPRSEMLADQTRASGGRAILGVVPVARRPAAITAPELEAGAIELDGQLDEAAWAGAGAVLLRSRTGEPGADIDEQLGGPTRVWFAWDREQLYVAASLPDPDLYARHTRRDDPLYREEAFEVFFAADASGARYLEHQVSARNVKFDARFPEYRKGDEAWNGSWDSAVLLDGELDDRGGDRGWTVELAFSWSELCAETNISCPPEPGQQLRTNVFRLDKPEREAQVGLALSPTLEPDFHAWRNAAVLTLGPTLKETQ